MHPTGNPRIVQRLAQEGKITPEQQEAALNHQQMMGGRIEEALLDTNAIEEGELLKFLASVYQTRFVSTEKLARADIDRSTLELVSKKLAEQETIFPVLFDKKTSTLSVVTPDPDNQNILHEVQMSSGVRKVQAFVGRPLAVKAAINKNYNGDIHAFANLDKNAHAQFTNMLNVFERNLVSEETMAVALAEERPKERVLTEEDMERGASGKAQGSQVANESYLESLNVLVSLLENGRTDLRGHSAQVARLVRKISERIGIDEATQSAFTMAAYLHDIGKMSAYHLTSLNVSEYEGHRVAATKSYRSPQRLMEAAGLPKETREALERMYERFDGKGMPGEMTGKDIPLGARLLAIADTYADITQNPRNPFRKTLRPVQACEVLARYKGTIFDPNLVDLFKHTVTGDDLKARLLANRHLALLVDPDPEETTVLELRLIEQGFEVQIARSTDQALKMLQGGEVEVVISELDIKPQDGFALLQEAKGQKWGKVPWVIMTHQTSRTAAQKAFELGAADYVTKPVSADLLVAKIKTIMEREATAGGGRGVSGSLEEMGLPEIVQVLWHGRKTGSLKIRTNKESGEIHFVDGAIYNALFGTLRGPDAFYAMLRLPTGDFVLDPKFRAEQQVIQENPESLLLEGMRLLDESRAGNF